MTEGEAPPGVTKLGMPKWGLSMREGKVTDWLVAEGEEVGEGEELFEVETEKIDGAVESPAAGVLRRQVAQVGAVVPVGGLVGVLADPTVPDAEVGGRRLRYLERGPDEPAGDPVVLLHGFGGDLNNWLFNTDKLAERRRVYALDLPGHGESSKDVGAGDLAAFAEVLGGFLDAVGAARAHLIGHSMGGAVALAYALEHPDRVASITLVAPAGLGEDINPDYIDGFVAAERRRELKGVLELLFADQGLVSRKLVDDVLRYKRLDGVEEALRQIAGAMYPSGRQTAVLTGDLDRLQAPALVVWGAQDRVLPAAHGQALAGRARVEVLAGAGHSPHMEAANEVNRLVGGFLDELEGEPR